MNQSDAENADGNLSRAGSVGVGFSVRSGSLCGLTIARDRQVYFFINHPAGGSRGSAERR